MRTGLATLKLLNKDFYRSLNARSEDFAGDLGLFFKEINIPVSLSHFKSMLSLRFSVKSVKNYLDAQNASSSTVYAKLFHHLLSQGIYWPPADLESFFISGMHTKKDLRNLMVALKIFFGENHLNTGGSVC